jgi:DUF4097 and DUF4098 domain-containing protein YvlB
MRTLALLLSLAAASLAHAQTLSRSSMGGDIVVAAAPGGATLRTMGGDVRVRSGGGKVIAKTMGGNVRLNAMSGSVTAGTMGGEVEVELIGAAKRTVELRTMGGNVELIVPADFAGDFDIELERDRDGNDTIESDFPLKVTESERWHWFKRVTVLRGKGTSGSGTNRVRITAIGGGVRIRRK